MTHDPYMTRRAALLGLIPLGFVAACTQAQQDATLIKIQGISASLTDLVTRYLLAIAPAEVAVISANNAKIQALVAGDWVGTAREVIGGTVRVILAVMPRLLPLLPAGISGSFDIVLGFLSGFAGIVRAGTDGKPTATIDEAAGAAAALRSK